MTTKTADRSTRELLNSQLRLADDLVFTPQTHGNDSYCHIESRTQGAFFRIGHAEYVFVSLLDRGAHTVAQALTLTVRQLGEDALTQQQGLQVATWLLKNQLATFADDELTIEKPSANSKSQPLNPFWMKLSFGSPDGCLRTVSRWLGWLFGPWAMLIGLGTMCVGATILLTHWNQFSESTAEVFSPNNWLWLGLAWLLLKITHELAHGVACQRYGGEVRDTGLVFILFAPMAYVDVTSCWRFPSRWQRIHVAAAGMYIELVLASLAAIAWAHVESPVALTLLRNVILMASLSTIVFNANPLMRFDGYYILADLLRIPNLSTDGAEEVRNAGSRLFYGTNNEGRVTTRGFRRWCVRIYGFAAAFWRILICVSLTAAAAVLWHGAGLTLALMGVAAWFGRPMARLGIDLMRRYHEDRLSCFRALAIGSALAGVLIVGTLVLPWPGAIQAPAIVEFADLQVLRSPAAGFVSQVFVEDGQKVKQGQLLVELRNDELVAELRELETVWNQEQVRQRVALDHHDAAKWQIAQYDLAAMESRIQQLKQRVEGLRVLAPEDGIVVQRDLDQLSGVYFKEGDLLLSLADDTRKELVISVSQSDIDAISPLVGSRVGFRIGTRFSQQGELQRLDPRASTQLPHAALAATAGGPLTIHKTDDGEPQLAVPRFRGVVRIASTTAAALGAGERGYARFGLSHHSIAVYGWAQFSQWLERLICPEE